MEQAALQKRRLRAWRRASISLGSSSVRNSSKGRLSRKKLVSLMVMASAMARSSAGFLRDLQVLHQFFQMRHALVAQQLGQPRLEQIVARGVKHILREPEDKLAKIAVVDALGSLHD